MDLNPLHSFLGYGDFRNADFLVISKHEGANNEKLEQELDARTNYFGLEKEYWLDREKRLNGYWHPSAKKSGEIKRELFGEEEKYTNRFPDVVKYPARMLFALEEALHINSMASIDKWFKGANEISKDVKNKLNASYDDMYSYTKIANWKTALSHYQPLLRAAQSWPYTELKKSDYTNIFEKTVQLENPRFAAWRKKREEILANLLKEYPKKVIFCTGNFQKDNDSDSLKEFFEREFQADLNPFGFNGKLKGLYGEFSYNNQKTIVIHTQGLGSGGGLAYDEVCKITKVIYRKLKREKSM
ncbi:hypothetical protein [Niallia nealsonii]|uniref:Uncharacterized protein n=1 Tax=Niallia nealsonii TaxID=115979 RepID=A0A2N0Z727_9BACI|nr:hypothetical protein [Niallia nealsonii]PKG25297.1 hypothetical protein CWS01_02130 [Niallia nealsonii]